MRHHRVAILCGLFGILAGATGMALVFHMDRQPGQHGENSGELPRAVTAEANAFRLVPCSPVSMPHQVLNPCLLVLAGGKRVLFGAPMDQDWRGIGPLDGVFLFDGRPESSGGLLGLRYETWSDGRNAPLLLVTGELMVDTVQALDDALIVPDALLQLERPADLDARHAGFSPKPIPPDKRERLVFDTGDLKVFASGAVSTSGDQVITYRVGYRGRSVELLTCGGVSHTNASPDARVQPVVEQERLTVLLRKAMREKLYARVADLRRAGRVCSGLIEASMTAHADGIDNLILLYGGKSSSVLHASESETKRSVLTSDGIEFEPF